MISLTQQRAATDSELNWHSIQLQTMRWVPTFLTQLADPFTTLRYHFDVQKMFSTHVTHTLDDADNNSEAAAIHTTKRGSLRRALSKVTGVGGGAAASSGSPTMPPRKERPGDTRVPHARIEIALSGTISDEVARIIRELSSAVDAYVALMSIIVGKCHDETSLSIAIIAPYALLDCTVTQHPRIKQLRLADNRVYIEIGRAQLRSHLYAVTAAHGYGIEQAERRYERTLAVAGEWLQSVAGEGVRDVLPVFWSLHPTSHEPLSSDDYAACSKRIMSELPLIIIGTFHMMTLARERDIVLETLLKYTF